MIENVHTVQKDEPRTHCSVMNHGKMIAKEKKYFLIETNTQLLQLSAVGKYPVVHTTTNDISVHVLLLVLFYGQVREKVNACSYS